MRFTFLLPGYPWKPSGGAHVVYQYAEHLAALGHDATIVHSRRLPGWDGPSDAPLGRRLRGMVRRWLEVFVRPRPSWRQVDPRVRLVYAPEPTAPHVPDGDVVVATFWPTVALAEAMPASKGVPMFLVQHHEIWAGDEDDVNGAWRRPVQKVVIARWLEETAREIGCDMDDVERIPNGVEHGLFGVRTPIDERRPRVIMMYSDAAWKGCADGLAAIERARAVHPELEVTLFGIWPRPDDLPAAYRYEQKPPRELLASLYDEASICICPSWSEGWGLPGLEAMASGCALASTSHGGVADYAEHGVNALLCEPRDVDALTDNLLALLDDDALRRRIAHAGYDSSKRFDWNDSARRFAELAAERVAARDALEPADAPVGTVGRLVR